MHPYDRLDRFCRHNLLWIDRLGTDPDGRVDIDLMGAGNDENYHTKNAPDIEYAVADVIRKAKLCEPRYEDPNPDTL